MRVLRCGREDERGEEEEEEEMEMGSIEEEGSVGRGAGFDPPWEGVSELRCHWVERAR